MTPRELPDLARLWQEQIDPAELAGLQALAKTIKRTARRRKLFDYALGVFMCGLFTVALLVDAAPLPKKLGYILFMLAPMVWGGWKRHRITVAARALVVDDPRAFFAAAIENARVEFSFYTLSVCLMLPFFLLTILLIYAARGVTSFDFILVDMFETHFVKTMVYGAIFVFLYVWVIRADLKLRQQLRRLESMSREWDEQATRDRE